MWSGILRAKFRAFLLNPAFPRGVVIEPRFTVDG
jgi:hypothetical protein